MHVADTAIHESSRVVDRQLASVRITRADWWCGATSALYWRHGRNKIPGDPANERARKRRDDETERAATGLSRLPR